MPTLLQINVVSNFGSTGRIAEEIGEVAIRNGWQSYIAFGRLKRPSKSNLIKIGTFFEIKFHGLVSIFLDRHGFASSWATRRFIAKVKNIKPDIIHIHNLHGYYININILFNYLKETDIPVVWTLHDCWPFTGHCPYFDFVGCNKWINGCYSCPQKGSYPTSILYDNSKRNYYDKKLLFNSLNNLTLVSVSNWLNSLVRKSFLANYPNIVIHNGVNLDVFNYKNNSNSVKKDLGISNSFLILGVASMWNSRKGLNDFLELSKLIDDSCKIVLVGVNEKQQKLLPDNIIGISRTENVTKLADIYSTADLFLNLTYEDNFPTTNLEALASGTPILTYNTGGSIEAVSIETGFVVEKGDFKTILKIIELVKKEGKLKYQNHCRSRAESLFNKNKVYESYVSLYENLLVK